MSSDSPLVTQNSAFLFTCVQHALPSRDTGDQIASLLMEQLGGLQYPDALVTFFSDMSQLMHSHASALDAESTKGGADISSAMGFYIRHCCVSFHMLAFEVRSPLTFQPKDHNHSYSPSSLLPYTCALLPGVSIIHHYYAHCHQR